MGNACSENEAQNHHWIERRREQRGTYAGFHLHETLEHTKVM